ncbi:Conidiation protein 6-domain-containing protein [Panaeolus papilionaceus]|nr:Conidiation protein 6-domain-containing protein [Panaeolus papilionaceus]
MSSHEEHQARGYKAAIKNPRVSDEAKENAKQHLKDLDHHGAQTSGGQTGGQRSHEDNVIRGYKAALHNPRVSDEAKARAEEFLEERDAL